MGFEQHVCIVIANEPDQFVDMLVVLESRQRTSAPDGGPLSLIKFHD